VKPDIDDHAVLKYLVLFCIEVQYLNVKPDILHPIRSKFFTVISDIVHWFVHVKPDIHNTVKPDIGHFLSI